MTSGNSGKRNLGAVDSRDRGFNLSPLLYLLEFVHETDIDMPAPLNPLPAFGPVVAGPFPPACKTDPIRPSTDPILCLGLQVTTDGGDQGLAPQEWSKNHHQIPLGGAAGAHPTVSAQPAQASLPEHRGDRLSPGTRGSSQESRGHLVGELDSWSSPEMLTGQASGS